MTETDSDHLIIVTECNLRHKHMFKWIEYTTKKVNEERIGIFNRKLKELDWNSISKSYTSADELTKATQKINEDLHNECFPRQHRKRKTQMTPESPIP